MYGFCWLLAFGRWRLAFGVWPLAFGCWLLAVGRWLLAFGRWLLAFGFWLLAFGRWRLGLMDFGFLLLIQCLEALGEAIAPVGNFDLEGLFHLFLVQ